MAQRSRSTAAASPAKSQGKSPSRRPAVRGIALPAARLARFCRRWSITELAVFGSALTGNLRSGSDIDLLATFAEDATWTLLDHVRMQDELSQMLGRHVDLLSREGVESSRNPLRRTSILESAKVVYPAG